MADTKYVGMMFSPESIQQIVAGNKTQTRRPVKQSLVEKAAYFYVEEETQYSSRDKKGSAWLYFDGTFHDHRIPAPVAKGDIIYVKEAWMNNPNYLFQRSQGLNHPEHYVKSSVSAQFLEEWPRSWKSRMYMPKAAARHFLEVLDVRVERLRDISREDAIAEGIQAMPDGMFKDYSGMAKHGFTWEKKSFKTMWDSVNRGKNRPKWADNPLVFAITFRYLDNHKNPFQ
mgnify:CR=1 FL=1